MQSIDKILSKVQKPTRYTGGEVNSVVKENAESLIRFAFCFPDTYEIGMSHLGMKILYSMLNSRDDVWCERVFTPWVDMQEQMREHGIALFGLESRQPITNFDFLGFTLQYEMSYTNILNMLDLANIPALASERGDDAPIICVGGPCAYNCEPLADFIDFAMMGEGEEVLNEVVDVYKAWKEGGKKGGKIKYLEDIAEIEGVYVPMFYSVSYNADGTVESIRTNNSHAKEKVRKRIINNLDDTFILKNIVVPFGEIVHDRVMLELFRGCIRGCRFCQAGYIYRPVRQHSRECLSDAVDSLLNCSGYDEISLSSLSTSDYTELEQLTNILLEKTEKEKISLSLPSLRIDNFSLELMQKVQKVRKSGITFAPEAGTQRLRDVINKNVTEENLMKSVSMVFGGGWTNVKLYFMIGLPTETHDDVAGIADLANKVLDQYYKTPAEQRAKNINITVSTSSFVPKPFTPFQWAPQDNMESLMEKQALLRSLITNRKITYNWHASKTSYLEGVFARGDRRLGKVLMAAYKNGCRFDGWDEHFKFDAWKKAFEQSGIDPNFYNMRERSYDEILPWDHIDIGVTKKFLMSENEKAIHEQTTPNCREKCSGCGASCFGGGVCFE